MAFNFSPKIVTDGLVLHLDAANTKSYVSESVTWIDLSRSRLTGTLVNGPTFDSGNGGSIVFDGTDDYISSFPTQISGTGSKTISVWFKTSTTVRSGLCGTRGAGVSNSTGWVLTINRTTPGNLTYFHTAGTIAEVTAGMATNTWYNACVAYNLASATLILYVNGSMVGSPFTSVSTIVNSPFNGVIGAEDGAYSNKFTGNIAQVSIYNQALSAREVLQNFNATRGRFGL